MAAFEHSERIDPNYGRCLVLTTKAQEMVITLDLGPRIIDYRLAGGKNVFWNDLDRVTFHDDEELKNFYGQDACWYLYGGHRFWVSPEVMPDTYYPDNQPVSYHISGNTVILSSGVQRKTGWEETISISLHENAAKASIKHVLANRGAATKTGAIWALSVMAPGGIALAPMPNEDTGFLANRTLMLWPYNKMSDRRFLMGDDYLALRQDAKSSGAFKIGINNTKGKALYANRSAVFVKTYSPNHPNGSYPDNGVSLELYTCPHFLELETLGELKALAPGESTEHTEIWSLYPAPNQPVLFDYQGLRKFL